MGQFPTLRSLHVGEGTVYSFRFDGFGWAIVVVSDATGVLSILSDWGNWSHRWHIDHLGAPTLHHFLARTDYHYVGSKVGVPEWVGSVEATARGLKRRICERRRESGANYQRDRYATRTAMSYSLSKAEAREAWEAIEAWAAEGRADNYDGLWDWFEEPWQLAESEHTPQWETWTKFLWPTIQKAIRDQVAARTPETGTGSPA